MPGTVALVSHQVVPRGDGQGRVNYEIVRAALEAGYRFRILAVKCAPDIAAHPQVQHVRLNDLNLPTQLLRNMAFTRASTRWLNAHRAEIDLVHVCGYVTRAEADVNSVHFVHGGWLANPSYPFRWIGGPYAAYQRLYTALNARWEKFAYAASRKVVAVSEKIADELSAIDVDRDRLVVIHNGVDVDEFRPGAGDRRRFMLPEDKRLFLFVGDIRTPRKGLDVTLGALAQIEDAHLVVAGAVDGSPFPERASNLGLGDRVHFLGKVADIPELMRSVDVFVFPSRYEAMSLVLLEALASGLPIITARTAGGAEVIGEGGVVLEHPDAVAELAQWMRELARNETLRAGMGRTNRETAVRYTWRRMADAYLDVYSDLIAAGRLARFGADTPGRA